MIYQILMSAAIDVQWTRTLDADLRESKTKKSNLY